MQTFSVHIWNFYYVQLCLGTYMYVPYKAQWEEVLCVFWTVGWEFRVSFFSRYLKHGSCWLKLVPRRVALQHLHYRCTRTPVIVQSETWSNYTILAISKNDSIDFMTSDTLFPWIVDLHSSLPVLATKRKDLLSQSWSMPYTQQSHITVAQVHAWRNRLMRAWHTRYLLCPYKDLL